MPTSLHDIPPEVLAGIFDRVGLHDDDASARTRIALASVCEAWRDTVYSSPQFWTTLRFSFRRSLSLPEELRLVAYMENWFSRAGSLLLDLELTTQAEVTHHTPSHLITFLVRTAKWKALSFSIVAPRYHNLSGRAVPWLWMLFREAGEYSRAGGSACWASLLALKILASGSSIVEVDPLPLYKAAPSIRSLHIAIMNAEDAAWLLVDWTGVRDLYLKGMFLWSGGQAVQFYFSVLSQASRLKTLRMEDSGLSVHTIESQEAVSPIANDSLSSLDTFDSPFIRSVFGYLSLPNLTSLRIHGQITVRSMTLGTAIAQLVQRSNCHLQNLCIEDSQLVEEGVLIVLRLLPTLKHLSLACRTPVFETPHTQAREFLLTLAKEASENPAFLPHLKVFHYRDQGIDDIKDVHGSVILAFKQAVDQLGVRDASAGNDEGHHTGRHSRLEAAQVFFAGREDPTYSIFASIS
ncbi:hypothetical protein NMY22_g2732 [Coprinellus aureogranulatus]|nr:hypothetical protein NMY22_g2732 [Coprinellus aureogranulatus]